MATKICPFCAEEIKKDAIKCKHCGEWLDNKKQSTKSIISRSQELIKEKKETRLTKRYSHLYLPTNDKPIELNNLKFYNTYLMHYSKRIEYTSIISIFYRATSSSYNVVVNETDNELKLYLDLPVSENNFPLEKRESDEVISTSAGSFMGMGSSKKLREKFNFINNYLKEVTFKSRYNRYKNQLNNSGYFYYPRGFKIFSNGDILKKEKIVANIVEAKNKNLLDYGNSLFSSFTGRVQLFDPFSLIIWPSQNSGRFLLGNKVSLEILHDKDVFDTILNDIINSAKFSNQGMKSAESKQIDPIIYKELKPIVNLCFIEFKAEMNDLGLSSADSALQIIITGGMGKEFVVKYNNLFNTFLQNKISEDIFYEEKKRLFINSLQTN